jgi:hypothetical protein
MHLNVGGGKWQTSHPPFHPLERCTGMLCIESLLVPDIFWYFRTRENNIARPARCLACTQFQLRFVEEQKQFLCVYVTYLLNLGFRRSAAEYRTWHSYAGFVMEYFPLPRLFYRPHTLLDSLYPRSILIPIPFTMRWNQRRPYILHPHKSVRHSSQTNRGISPFIERTNT